MSLREYARHRGCYPRAVEAALRAGRIRRDEQGRIDSEQADHDWEVGTSPYLSAAAKANGAVGQQIRRVLASQGTPEQATQPRSAPVSPERAPVAPNTDIAAYAQAR